MTIKERLEAEETKLGKFFKYVIGYAGVVSGIVTDTVITYLPAVREFVPEWLTHGLVVVGVCGYVIGKLSAKPKPQNS